jgi:hypothetical protein
MQEMTLMLSRRYGAVAEYDPVKKLMRLYPDAAEQSMIEFVFRKTLEPGATPPLMEISQPRSFAEIASVAVPPSEGVLEMM